MPRPTPVSGRSREAPLFFRSTRLTFLSVTPRDPDPTLIMFGAGDFNLTVASRACQRARAMWCAACAALCGAPPLGPLPWEPRRVEDAPAANASAAPLPLSQAGTFQYAHNGLVDVLPPPGRGLGLIGPEVLREALRFHEPDAPARLRSLVSKRPMAQGTGCGV